MEVNGGQEVLVKQLFTFFMLGQNQSIKSTHTCCFEGLVSAPLLLVSFLLLEKILQLPTLTAITFVY